MYGAELSPTMVYFPQRSGIRPITGTLRGYACEGWAMPEKELNAAVYLRNASLA